MTTNTTDLRFLAARTAAEAGRVRCRLIRSFAFDIESSNGTWLAPLERHIDACLGCQAELARARSVVRDLRGMADENERAPAGLGEIAFDAIPMGEPSEYQPGWTLSPAALASASAAAGAAMGVAFYLGRRLASTGS